MKKRKNIWDSWVGQREMAFSSFSHATSREYLPQSKLKGKTLQREVFSFINSAGKCPRESSAAPARPMQFHTPSRALEYVLIFLKIMFTLAN